MKPEETKRIYEAACNVRRLVPQQDEGKEWHNVLRNHEARDANAALSAWWTSGERDERGELRSKWLPTVRELQVIVMREQNRRACEASAPKEYIRSQCACRYIVGDYYARGTTPTAECPRCKGQMNVINREAA